MYLWNRFKEFMRHRAEKKAKKKVLEFVLEVPVLGQIPYPELKKHKERLSYKRDLIANYTYQPDDDLLAKKQEFIELYTVNEKQQRDYFTQRLSEEGSDWACCKAWRDHEQVERGEARMAWYVVSKRNYHTHMRQKFMCQKTK